MRPNLFKKCFYTFALCCIFLLQSYSSNAATFIWTGNNSPSFSDPGNWDQADIPGSGDDVVIDGSSVNNCEIDIPVDLGSGTFTLSTRQVIFSGGGDFNCRTFTVNSGSVNFANAGTLSLGYVTVNGGTFTASNRTFNVTYLVGLGGTLDAASATFNITQELFVLTGFTQTNCTFIFNGTSTQYYTLSARVTNVTIDKTSGSMFLSSTPTITGTLHLANGTFTIGNNSIVFEGGNTPITRVAGQLSGSANSSISFGTANNEGGNAYTLPANLFASGSNTLGNLTFRRDNTLVLNNNLNITNTINMFGGSGSLDITGTTITFLNANVPITGVGASRPNLITSSTTNLVFGTAGNTSGNAYTIPNNVFSANPAQLGNVTINRTNGLSMGNQAIAINGTLTLTAGVFNISNRHLIFQNGNTPVSVGSGSILTSLSSELSFGTAGNTGGNAFTLPNNLFSSASSQVTNFNLNRTNQLTLGSQEIAVKEVVNIAAGTLNANGSLRLISTSGYTAMVTEVGATGNIIGNVVIDRFIPSVGRRFRFIAAPVLASSNVTFRDGWQNDTYGNGFNMFITGGTGGSGPVGLQNYNTEGFDWTLSNSPSIFTYDETNTNLSQVWVPINNVLTQTITAGTGYRAFIRGDRSDAGRLDGSVNTQNATTLRVRGAIPVGNFPFTLTFTGASGDPGWNLLGNPYPSPVDWDEFHDAGRTGSSPDYSGTDYEHLDATIYIYDPNLNGYRSYNAFSNVGTLPNGQIPLGQAFFVKTTNSNPSMMFRESHKINSNPYSAFKTDQPDNHFKVTLKYNEFNADEFVFKYFAGSSETYDPADIIKFQNPTVNISSYGSDNKFLTVSCMTEDAVNDTIHLAVSGSVTGTYQFAFAGLPDFAPGKGVYLIDNFTSSVVNMRNTASYDFNINTSNTASFGNNRFIIVIDNQSNTGLPVKLTTLKASKSNGKAVLTWQTASEISSAVFEVEKLNSENVFVKVGEVKAAGNKSTVSNYTWYDIELLKKGSTYFRLKMIDQNGKFEYSSPVSVKDMDGVAELAAAAFPVPASKNISVDFHREVKGNLHVTITSLYGNKVDQFSTTATSNMLSYDIHALAPGVYFMEVTDDSGKTEKIRFIKD